MPVYKIFAGERHKPLELICIKEFDTHERAEQYAFDCALDKLFPYSYLDEKNTNTYCNALDRVDYFAEEI